ncbi:MAG: HigA family addiction module antitoxin [Clostridiales bacterium]|nr:HigA family addiction module antitoxin [Clostridiales bacterium]
MANGMNQYSPDYAVLPGDHIEELIELHGMSQKELAMRTGVTPKHINTVIRGKARITPEFAHSLAMIFDYSAEMWMGFQGTYYKRGRLP